MGEMEEIHEELFRAATTNALSMSPSVGFHAFHVT
jgi:hypothetical protein